MTLTAFVKISTVLQIVRGAIGAQGVPTNTVMMAFAGALTVLAMAPVGIAHRRACRAAARADGRARDSDVGARHASTRRASRCARFLRAQRAASASAIASSRSRAPRGPSRSAPKVGRDDLVVLVPAFVVTELLEAFALGFALYLPFLVIDLVVSNVLLALGMQMMSPNQVSLPFKLLLFVAIDGWGLLAQVLVTGYKPG